MPTSVPPAGEGTAKRAGGRPRAGWRPPDRVRRAALSVLLMVLVLVAAAESLLPDSATQQSVSKVTKPIATLLGLDQSWGVFAPTPPVADQRMVVYVTMSDGGIRTWTRDDADPPAQWFSANRWRSFEREVIWNPKYRRGFAQWVVKQLTEPGEHAVRIQMVYESEAIPPPGGHTDERTRKLLYDKQLSTG